MFFLLAVLPACWYQKSESFFFSAPSGNTSIPLVTHSFAEQRVILFYCAAIFCLPVIALFMAIKISSLSHSVRNMDLRFFGLCWYLNSFVPVVQGGESFHEAGTFNEAGRFTNGYHSTPSPAMEVNVWGTFIYATSILLLVVGIVLAGVQMARLRRSRRTNQNNKPARFQHTPPETDQHQTSTVVGQKLVTK